MKEPLCLLAILSFVFLAHALELKFDLDSAGFDALPARIMKTVNEADEWNTKGIAALDKKDLATAMACFDQALAILPGYSDAINNRGVVRFRKGDIPGAQEIWNRLAAAEPSYAIASYNLALVSLYDRQYDAAVRLLERAMRADRQFIEPQVRLGAIYLLRGEKEKALEKLKKAYSAASAHPDAWSFYAYALIENRDTATAVSILKKQGDKVEALKLLAGIETARHNTAAALVYVSRAVALGADHALLLDLADLQRESGKCTEALASIKTHFSRNTAYTADAYLSAGIVTKECGDLAAAQQYFEQGVRNFPRDEILRYNLGQIYFYQKKLDQAETAWSALADSVQDPSLLHLRAIAAKRRNDLAAAEKLIRNALAMDNQAAYHDFLGIILYRKGDAAGAAAEFRAALAINPGLSSAQTNLSLCAKSPADLAQSAALLEQRRSSCDDSCADIVLSLSMIYYYQKNMDKAVAVLAGFPEKQRDERIYRALATYYREQQEWGKAITALETAVKTYVSDPQTDNLLAETYLMAGYYDKAIGRFSQLLSGWQQNPWRIYYQMGYAYMEQNDLTNAKTYFEKSLNSKKDNVASQALLAFIYNRQGDVIRARELWKKTLSGDPDNPSVWINMGYSYENEGNCEQALIHYKKAADLKKNDAQIQINIGNVYTTLGQYTDALAAYRQALNSPQRAIALYNVFLVYVKKRDKELAEKTLVQLAQEFASSSNTKRAQADMAVWNGDTAGATSIIENLSDKEPGDWLTLAQLHASRGNAQKATSALGNVPDEAQYRAGRAAVKVSLAFQQGQYAEVIAAVRESRDTGFAAQYNVALANYQLKNYSEALSVASRLARTAQGSDRADLCRLAGNAAFSLKQWEAARQWYSQLSNIEARSAIVQYNLAVASYNLGQPDESYAYYLKSRELDPAITNADIEKRYAAAHNSPAGKPAISMVDSLYNAAVDFQTAGSDSAAQALYLDVLSRDSTYNMAWNNLGAIHGKRGEIDSAEYAYMRAIGKRYDIPETYANLINLYIQLEEFSKARIWLIKGIGHNPESEILQELKKALQDAEKKAKKKR